MERWEDKTRSEESQELAVEEELNLEQADLWNHTKAGEMVRLQRRRQGVG